jgi:exodeoxyribonuclease VIII
MESNYYENTAISNSKLTYLAKSPAHFKHLEEVGFKETEALEFGRAFHCAILEPDKFLSSYMALPQVDKRTKEGKALFSDFIERNMGKCFLGQEEFDKILTMSKKLLSSPAVCELLQGEYEQEFYWTDEQTGIDCKSKLDVYNRGVRVVDIKTTESADPETFHRSIFKYAYHRQGGMYIDATQEVLPYYIIAIEKDAPHEFSILRLSEEVLEYGRKEYKSLLEKCAQCRANNYWPGYETKYFDAFEVELPSYMRI